MGVGMVGGNHPRTYWDKVVPKSWENATMGYRDGGGGNHLGRYWDMVVS